MPVKTFPYAVVYNGVFYTANTPIKEKEAEKPVKKGGGKNDKGTSRKS